MRDFGQHERRQENEGDIDMVTATGRDSSDVSSDEAESNENINRATSEKKRKSTLTQKSQRYATDYH